MRLTIILGCLAAALAITACGSSKKSSSSAATTSVPAATTGTGPPGGLPLTLTNFKFVPNTIRGEGGHQLKLHLKNTGTVEHNFSIDAQHIDQDLEPGKSATVTITVSGSGTVQFYCSYHKKSHNMVGSITVGGATPAPKATPTNTSTSGGGSGY